MTLFEYYRVHFDITQYHRFSLTELENMIPFERNLYIEMLAEKVKEESKQ